MGVHIAGGILVMLFGILLIVIGAVFYKPAKRSTYNAAVHLVIFVLGSLMLLGGSGWLWWAIDKS